MSTKINYTSNIVQRFKHTKMFQESLQKERRAVYLQQLRFLLFNLPTCMMVIDPIDIGTQRVLIDGKETERVNKFKYLGSLVTVDSNSTTDIKARLTSPRHATLQLTGIWKAKDIGMDPKKQLVRSLIWSTALYDSESGALKKCDEKLVTAFEMWVWRRMLRYGSFDLRHTNNNKPVNIPEWFQVTHCPLKVSQRGLSESAVMWQRQNENILLRSAPLRSDRRQAELFTKGTVGPSGNTQLRRARSLDRRRSLNTHLPEVTSPDRRRSVSS